MQVASFSGEHASDGAQIEGIGYQRVKGVGGNRHNPTLAQSDRSTSDRIRIGLFRVNFNQFSGHGGYRGPIASATSIAIWYLPNGALS